MIYVLMALSASFVPDSAEAEQTLDVQTIEKCAKTAGIDPVLFYAVGLAESGKSHAKGAVGPWPWTILSPDGPQYFPSRAKAEGYLNDAVVRFKPHKIDVGAFQVNMFWHGERFVSYAEMLDPVRNCTIAASVLKEAMNSAPGDLTLGVGRYHHWRSSARARAYGSRVLAMAQAIRALPHHPFKGKEHEIGRP